MVTKIKEKTSITHLGLNDEQVEKRIKAKLTNKPVKAPSKSMPQIVFRKYFYIF